MDSEIFIDPGLEDIQQAIQNAEQHTSMDGMRQQDLTIQHTQIVSLKAYDERNGPIAINDWVENLWSEILQQMSNGNKYAYLELSNFIKTIAPHESNWLLQNYEATIRMPGICRQDFDLNVVVYHPDGDIPVYGIESPFPTPTNPCASEMFSMSPESVPDTSTNTRKAKSNVAKVPRPPNAFILYRRDFHYVIKEQNPGLHNNVISQIIGRRWAGESEELKNHYANLAKVAKEQHASQHPEYQYKPRRPCEKKRRLTKNKKRKIMEQLMAQSGETGNEHGPFDPEALSGGWNGVRETAFPGNIDAPNSSVATLIGYHNAAMIQSESSSPAHIDYAINRDFLGNHFGEMNSIDWESLQSQVNGHATDPEDFWALPEHRPINGVIPGAYLLDL